MIMKKRYQNLSGDEILRKGDEWLKTSSYTWEKTAAFGESVNSMGSTYRREIKESITKEKPVILPEWLHCIKIDEVTKKDIETLKYLKSFLRLKKILIRVGYNKKNVWSCFTKIWLKNGKEGNVTCPITLENCSPYDFEKGILLAFGKAMRDYSPICLDFETFLPLFSSFSNHNWIKPEIKQGFKDNHPYCRNSCKAALIAMGYWNK